MRREIEHQNNVEASRKQVDEAADLVSPRAIPKWNVDVVRWDIITETLLLNVARSRISISLSIIVICATRAQYAKPVAFNFKACTMRSSCFDPEDIGELSFNASENALSFFDQVTDWVIVERLEEIVIEFCNNR